MATTTRKYEEMEFPCPKPESEAKGILLMLVCFVYTIVFFLVAGFIARTKDSLQSKVTDDMVRCRMWESEKKMPFDANNNIRNMKSQQG